MAATNYTPAQQRALRDLSDDYEAAARAVGFVIPGSTAGALIPFVPTPPQQHVFQTIREIHAFRYVEQARHLPSKAKREAWDLIWGRRLTPSEPSFAAAYEKALEFGPTKAIRLLNEHLAGAAGGPILDSVRLILGKPRQFGGTTCATWLLTLRSVLIENHQSFVVAHEEDAARDGLQKVVTFCAGWEHLAPEGKRALFPGVANSAKGELWLQNGSHVVVKTAAGKDLRAPKLDFLELGEFAHYDSNKAVDAIVTAVQDHCWIIKDSTAKGMGGTFYGDWQNSLYVKDAVAAFDAQNYPEKWNRYFRCFVAWWEDPRYVAAVELGEDAQLMATLSDYERAWVDRLGPGVMTPARLKWRRYKVLTTADPMLTAEQKVCQEFPGDDKEMFQTTGDRPFDGERVQVALIRAETAADKALYFKQSDRGQAVPTNRTAANLAIWRRPRPGAKYIIGADVAYGVQKDRSWAVVLERVDGVVRRQVAEWRGWIPSKAYAHVLVLLAEWYNNAFLICEAGTSGPGHSTMNTVVEDLHYPNVYRRRVLGRLGDPGFSDDSFYAGFQTSAGTKKTVIDELIYSFDNGQLEILSTPLLEEMSIFQRNEKGQYGAPSGCHDDGVMALAFANWGDNVHNGAPPLVDVGPERPTLRFEVEEDWSARDRELHAAMMREAAWVAAQGKSASNDAGVFQPVVYGGSGVPGKKAWWLT